MRLRWTLILVGLFGGGVFAASPAELTEPQRLRFLQKIQKSLRIPAELGDVSQAYLTETGSVPDYVLIQDLHKHTEVQNHIAGMILHAYHHWGVRKVFLEGAFTQVDLSVFQEIPSDARPRVLRRLITEGQLSGPEMAGAMLVEKELEEPAHSPFLLIGLEDPDLYWANVDAYNKSQAVRDTALEEIGALQRLRRSALIANTNIFSEQLERTENLVQLKMTPPMYDSYIAARQATPSTPVLDRAVSVAERFYALVNRRSRVFLENARERVPAAHGPRVLVVGGFHTEMMANHLKNEGLSVVVLTPRVTQKDSDHESVYQARMLDTISLLHVTRPFEWVAPIARRFSHRTR